MDLTIHPLAVMFPALSSDEYTALKDSIAECGQLAPIVVNAQGQILDGVHRHKACIEIGIEPRLKEAAPKLTEAQVILDANVKRRQLTDDQRVQLTAKFLPLIQAETAAAKSESLVKARKAKAEKSVDGKSSPQKRDLEAKHASSAVGKLAAKAEVSEYKATQAMKVAADPGLAEKVINGDKPLKEAAKELAAKSTENATQLPLIPDALDKPQANKREPKILSFEDLTKKVNSFCEKQIGKVLESIHPQQLEKAIDLIIDDLTALKEKMEG
jgi:ParB-like chromosome segregation protein Spo0J